MDQAIINRLQVVNKWIAQLKSSSDGAILLFESNESGKLRELRAELDLLQIPSDSFSGEVRINLSTQVFGCKLFYDREQFRKDVMLEDFQAPLGILQYSGDSLAYDPSIRKCLVDGQERGGNYFIENAESYLRLLAFFRSAQFADYDSSAYREFVILSPERGVFKVRYPSLVPIMDDSKKIADDCESIFERARSVDYRAFLRNEFIEFSKGIPEDGRIVSIITNLSALNESANRNYEIYVKKFSFEKLKSDLQHKKEQYFESLRELLNKILGQVASVPVSIAAAVFAEKQVKDAWLSLMLLIAYSLYSFVVYHFQLIFLKDLDEIKSDSLTEFENIRRHSGLRNDEIERESDKVFGRIRLIRGTIFLNELIVIVLLCMFVIYLLPALRLCWWTEALMILALSITFVLRGFLHFRLVKFRKER